MMGGVREISSIGDEHLGGGIPSERLFHERPGQHMKPLPREPMSEVHGGKNTAS
jgi:hypothetical protein